MTQSGDTSAKARQAQVAAYRAMGASARVRAALEMSEAARDIAVAGCRARHPDWAEADVQRAVAELLLGPDLRAR